MDRLLLTDAVHAIGALILDRRVPPSAEVDHVIGRGQRQAEASGAGREDHDVESLARLKLVHPLLACGPRHFPVDD
ncbi:MAG: hypothetical protein RML12_03915 [Xanthomonadales bacterium]|nr:hypothetical protein [Xanthomonadales bacterium]